MLKSGLNNNRIVIYLNFLLSICAISPLVAEKVNPKIIIIGAGASGIASAVKLLEYGFEDITILEAESRIGGRILTIPYGENVIDLGAQWCHGEERNLVYDLALKHNLLEHVNESAKEFSYARSNAEKLERNIAENLMDIVKNVKKKRNKEINEYDGSLGNYMEKIYNETFHIPDYSHIPLDIAKEFYQNFEKEESRNEGSDNLTDISSRDYMLFNEVKEHYLLNWKDKGYKEFLRLLMKTKETGKEFGILDGRIKLSKKVERISWQNKNYKSIVQCMDGEEFEADHVIVTVSLGVLKSNLNKMFEPPLPLEKQKAIKAIKYGSYNNIYLEFAKEFWNATWGGIYFLWRNEDLKELRASNFSWLEDVYGFETLSYQPRVLQGFIIGSGGRDIEMLPSKEIEAGIIYLFKKFMAIDVPAPVNLAISKWYSNPNFQGCYSYHAVETAKADVSNQHIANALKAICNLDNYVDLCEKPVLQFAGEATDSLHYATVHGAVETGFREAQRIRDYYAFGPQSSDGKE